MAESRLHKLSLAIFVLVVTLGIAFVSVSMQSVAVVVMWSLLIAAAQYLTVPAPSGQRLYLGIGVAAAVPLLIQDPAGVAAIYAFGVSGSWFAFVLRGDARSVARTNFVAETLALVLYAVVWFAVDSMVIAGGLEGAAPGLLATGAAGLAWYLVRASVQALVGLEREDLAVRYLWLLALEDWTVVVSLFATGSLFAFSWPLMRWWSVPVALMPYAFSHLAFVRYHGTRITYGQTIRALAAIPEVGGLAPAGHSKRTADLAVAIAREMGMHPDEVVELEYAALMHDIGRVTLNEPAILEAGYTDEDIARWGSQIIAEAPYLAHVSTLVREQHRPYRVPGVERDPSVPVASKVIKVASAYDSAINEQHLRPVVALEQIHQGAAYEYDPEIAASLRRVLIHRGSVAL